MTRTHLFKQMLQEEWRMHTDLFGRNRFAAFPLFIFLLTLLGTALLNTVNVTPEPILLGLHVLIGFFGLQTGSLAFIGTDAMRNVLGDNTYLVFSARTLPVSRKRLLGVFLIKDLVYYAGLFLLPMSLGFIPFITTSDVLSLTTIPLLWLSLAGTFMLGVALTMILISLTTTIPFGKPVAILAGGATLALSTILPLGMFTPYALFTNPSFKTAITGFAPMLLFVLIAVSVFSPRIERPSRTGSNLYNRLRNSAVSPPPLVTKMTIDLHRSSGGVYKVFFSAALLFAVTWALLDLATTILGFRPDAALAYSSLLSLTAFTTYNWLTQNDSPEGYLFYPLDIPDVFEAKRTLFTVISVPVGVVFYGGVILLENTDAVSSLLGVFVFLSLLSYLFGVTIYLSGFSPNEFLFDTVLFMSFAALVIAALVPVVLAAFLINTPAFPIADSTTYAAIMVESVILLGVGWVLSKRASGRWTHKLKTTE